MRPWLILTTALSTLAWTDGTPTGPRRAEAGELTVNLTGRRRVSRVGAIRRWDEGGKPTAKVDPKAKIDQPRLDATAEPRGGNRWVFRDLADETYDLIILAEGNVRIEGYRYPPIDEFDPSLPPTTAAPEDEARGAILDHIAKARHYENKVSPLFLASGGEKQVRILVQLVRDSPTSFDGDFGAPVATVRHEVWQYTNNFGGWVKDRRTEVLDRIILPRAELHRWTWIWEPSLGAIRVRPEPTALHYELPERFDRGNHRGWFPEAEGGPRP